MREGEINTPARFMAAIEKHSKYICINLDIGHFTAAGFAVLSELKTNRWRIPANIKYEYKGDDTVAEVRKCYDYCRQALA